MVHALAFPRRLCSNLLHWWCRLVSQWLLLWVGMFGPGKVQLGRPWADPG